MTSAVYNYLNEAKVWLPMTAQTHDAANVRTLDVSGNNLHFQFGDGVTANTFPTKLAKRGYYFNGANQRLTCVSNITNAVSEITCAILFREQDTLNPVVEYLFDHGDVASCRGILLMTSTGMRFYCGDRVNYANFPYAPNFDQVSFLCGLRTLDGYRRIYYNGIPGTPSNAGTSTPSTTSANNPILGNNYNFNFDLTGSILWYGYWEYALTVFQLQDLEMRLRRQLNDI